MSAVFCPDVFVFLSTVSSMSISFEVIIDKASYSLATVGLKAEHTLYTFIVLYIQIFI